MHQSKKNLFLLSILIFSIFIVVAYFAPIETKAVGECSSYGILAYYDILTDSCKCTSGYVWGEDIFGSPQCVSGDSICHDKYGYGSSYDSFSNSCECDYGYVFGKDSIGRTQCITETNACQNQLGLHSRSAYGGKCECSYGYVIDGGQCVDGDTYCRLRHGFYSDYDSLSNQCECDDGYTLDDGGQCVEKENNVYFKLLDINEDNDEILVESGHDYQNYILEYGLGCGFWIDSYLGQRIVLGLGTDFSVDYGDRIVLQNHDTTCQIFDVEWTNDDEFEDNESLDYVPTTYSPPASSFSSTNEDSSLVEPAKINESLEATPSLAEPAPNYETEIIEDNSQNTEGEKEGELDIVEKSEEQKDKKSSVFGRIIKFFKNLF